MYVVLGRHSEYRLPQQEAPLEAKVVNEERPPPALFTISTVFRTRFDELSRRTAEIGAVAAMPVTSVITTLLLQLLTSGG